MIVILLFFYHYNLRSTAREYVFQPIITLLLNIYYTQFNFYVFFARSSELGIPTLYGASSRALDRVGFHYFFTKILLILEYFTFIQSLHRFFDIKKVVVFQRVFLVYSPGHPGQYTFIDLRSHFVTFIYTGSFDLELGLKSIR